jgi:hypothetical protein
MPGGAPADPDTWRMTRQGVLDVFFGPGLGYHEIELIGVSLGVQSAEAISSAPSTSSSSRPPGREPGRPVRHLIC